MFAIDVEYLDGKILRGFHANKLDFNGDDHTLTISIDFYFREGKYQVLRNVKSFSIIQEDYME